MSDPMVGLLAVQETSNLAQSALPHAPVQPDPQPVASRRMRRLAALALHRLADRLEPAPRLSADTQ